MAYSAKVKEPFQAPIPKWLRRDEPIEPEDEPLTDFGRQIQSLHAEALANLLEKEAPLMLDRLGAIASELRSLTYAEMMELASGLWQPIATTPPATQEELARLIHGWSVGR